MKCPKCGFGMERLLGMLTCSRCSYTGGVKNGRAVRILGSAALCLFLSLCLQGAYAGDGFDISFGWSYGSAYPYYADYYYPGYYDSYYTGYYDYAGYYDSYYPGYYDVGYYYDTSYYAYSHPSVVFTPVVGAYETYEAPTTYYYNYDVDGDNQAYQYCGDGECGPGETKDNCAVDCGTPAYCGDGNCDGGETKNSCSVDCGTPAYCGNGVCDGGETGYNCPVDCGTPAYCGNGVCDGGETKQNCPVDCGTAPYCGDGHCQGGETRYSCPNDCGLAPYCGDGSCSGDETKQNCAKDCGLAPYCGDGSCDKDESRYSCPLDCGLPSYCGDGECKGDETKYSCSLDCGNPQCQDPTGNYGGTTCKGRQVLMCEDGFWEFKKSVQCCNSLDCPVGYNCEGNACVLRTICGDGRCLDDENPYNCPVDCGGVILLPPISGPMPPVPPEPQPQYYCGDGSCNNRETCSSCSQDCGQCPYCGDGSCNLGTESQQSCPQDCGNPAYHEIELVLEDECMEVFEETTGNFSLLISNKGNVPESLSLSAVGESVPFNNVISGSLTILAGETKGWGVQVFVPQGTKPGLYELTVNAQNADVVEQATLFVDVRLAPMASATNQTAGNMTQAGPLGAILVGDVAIDLWVVALVLVIALLVSFFFFARKSSMEERAARLERISKTVKSHDNLVTDGGLLTCNGGLLLALQECKKNG
jgi:hypothetical protein